MINKIVDNLLIASVCQTIFLQKLNITIKNLIDVQKR
jgi:hypothetical protein